MFSKQYVWTEITEQTIKHKPHIWTPIFKVETQFGRKPPLLLSQSSIFIIKKTSYNFMLVQTYTSTQAPTCRKATTFSRSPATTGKELQPPDFNTSFYWQDTSTFILKASTLRSIRFLQFLYQTSVRSFSFLLPIIVEFHHF